MSDFFESSAFLGVAVSLLSYAFGSFLKKKFKTGIFNPLLISIVITIVFLLCCNIDYDTYNDGAKYLSWLLTPATACLAIPLYQQIELLKKNHKAVLFGILSGVLTSLITIMVLAFIFKLFWVQSFLHILYKKTSSFYARGFRLSIKWLKRAE